MNCFMGLRPACIGFDGAKAEGLIISCRPSTRRFCFTDVACLATRLAVGVLMYVNRTALTI